MPVRKIDLNGIWDFVVDLDPKYRSRKRVYKSPPYARPDWERQHWQRVPVPGVWNRYSPALDIYEGVCWFHREFLVDSLPAEHSARLRFEGVNYLCRVFLNGREVGEHEGGYTEFVLDVTGCLLEGANHLSVCVDNRATTTRLPPCLGYFNYGGIHRNVTLELASGPSLDDLRITAEPSENGGRLSIQGCVRQYGGGLGLELRCEGQSARKAIGNDGSFSVETLVPGVEAWSPDNPRLYQIDLVLRDGGRVMDTCSETCGFRKAEAKEGGIYLNGKRLQVRGVCYVCDSPIHGVHLDPHQLEEDFRLFKELNINAVRCHYPMSRDFYRTCDRAGILVWVEPPVYCLHPDDSETGTPFSDPGYRELGRQMLQEMIASARNHPSVVFYGLGNECNTANPESTDFFQAMALCVREADPTRLVSYAALYGIVGEVAEIVDVLGINSYWGWYDKVHGGKGLVPRDDRAQDTAGVCAEPIDLSEMRKMLDGIRAGENTALLLTEFGADSIPGYLSASRDLWSEDYHADLLASVFDLAKEYPRISGTFPFCYCDYRDPSKVVNAYWNGMNYKGMVSFDRRKKEAFHTLSKLYGSLRADGD